jgi:hypothetical protein
MLNFNGLKNAAMFLIWSSLIKLQMLLQHLCKRNYLSHRPLRQPALP